MKEDTNPIELIHFQVHGQPDQGYERTGGRGGVRLHPVRRHRGQVLRHPLGARTQRRHQEPRPRHTHTLRAGGLGSYCFAFVKIFLNEVQIFLYLYFRTC